MLLGGGFDVFSPTSDDAKLDGLDRIGPGVMVAGIGAAVVGAVLLLSGGGDD